MVAALVAAELADAPLGHAGLLAFVLAILGLCFWTGFLASGLRPVWRRAAQPGFFLSILLAAFVAYFGWREARALGELARLIEPVPEIVDVTYVPYLAELQAVEAFAAIASRDAGPKAVSGPERGSADRVWLLKSRLSEPEAIAFHEGAATRFGWNSTVAGEGILLLDRGAERLIVVVWSNEPLPGTNVSYIYNAGAEPGPP